MLKNSRCLRFDCLGKLQYLHFVGHQQLFLSSPHIDYLYVRRTPPPCKPALNSLHIKIRTLDDGFTISVQSRDILFTNIRFDQNVSPWIEILVVENFVSDSISACWRLHSTTFSARGRAPTFSQNLVFLTFCKFQWQFVIYFFCYFLFPYTEHPSYDDLYIQEDVTAMETLLYNGHRLSEKFSEENICNICHSLR